LSHGEFAWTVRRHRNVHGVFKTLHGDTPLVTSLDAPFFTPSAVSTAPWNPYNSAHVDQNVHDIRGDLASIEEYQGVLYAWPCRPEDQSTATVVWPSSYEEGNAKCAYARLMEDEKSKITGERGRHYTQAARRVQVPSGGLLLWNSKTIHTGAQCGPRLAQAVCLEPVARRSEQERLAKLRLAALGLPSMHWASHGIEHDCIRRTSGCLTKGAEVKPQVSNSHCDTVLPLRNAIQPWCHAVGAQGLLESAENLHLELLERCVSEEAKAIL